MFATRDRRVFWPRHCATQISLNLGRAAYLARQFFHMSWLIRSEVKLIQMQTLPDEYCCSWNRESFLAWPEGLQRGFGRMLSKTYLRGISRRMSISGPVRTRCH